MRPLGLIAAFLLAGAASAQEFTIFKVVGKNAARVDAVLGKPLSVGQGGSFREYTTKRSSWYVTFTKGIASASTVTFRTAFTTPEQALKAIGIQLGSAKLSKTNILLRRWEKVAGLGSVEVQSLDGKRWETIEVTK